MSDEIQLICLINELNEENCPGKELANARLQKQRAHVDSALGEMCYNKYAPS